MAASTIKAINFDLDTNKMKELGQYPNGYNKLLKSFKEVGFEHRQGSGYISNTELTNKQVDIKLRKVVKQNSWLGLCVKKCDVTEIGQQFDMVTMVQRVGCKQKAKEHHISPELQAMRNGMLKYSKPLASKTNQDEMM